MWRVALALLACCQIAAAGSASIVTWNMRWFPGTKPVSTPELRVLQMSHAKEALLQMAPDILCVQEMRNWESFETLTSVLPHLTPLVVSQHPDSRSGAVSIQQVGIASIFPGVGAWSEVFRPSPDNPPRGFAFVALDVGDGKRLLLYSVHLKSNLGELAENIAAREEAARQIIRHADAMEKAYAPIVATIVAGDFNTDPTDPQFAGDDTFQTFYDAGFKWPWARTPPAERVTHPSEGRYPDATFDGFLIRGDISVVSCKPLLVGEKVSDHRAVEMRIGW